MNSEIVATLEERYPPPPERSIDDIIDEVMTFIDKAETEEQRDAFKKMRKVFEDLRKGREKLAELEGRKITKVTITRRQGEK